jgi:predicted membrane-bound spermidine synthase
MTAKPDKKAFIFLSIAFVEGAVVMACELLGAKMTAPFFGTTIYSWAAVLAVTLGGLAGGYYFGGMMTIRRKPETLLQFILFATGVFMVFMPVLGVAIMKAVINLNLLTGLVISLLVFLLPPVFLFGMVSPVIIAALVENAGASGKIAGRVYAVSTVGGVLNTLLLGFYIIPTFGIRWPSVSYGILLLVVAFLFTVSKKKALKAVILFFVVAVGIKLQAGDNNSEKDYVFRINYASEGLLGQIKVADYMVKTDSFGVMPVRGLLVNNTWQTVINLNDGTGLLDYIYFIRPMLSAFPKGSDVLLVGLGGGTLCTEIQKKGLNVEVVELDPRLPKLAKKHFGLNPRTKIITDDGRHFVQTTRKKYDLIIFDAFLGENPPWHLLTLESFEKVKTLLKPGGKFIIEFYGFLKSKNGMAGRSVFATLQKAGLNPQVIATSFTDGIERNFVYTAGLQPFSFDNLDYSGIKYTDKDISNLKDYLMSSGDFYAEDYKILTDDIPVLEEMLMNPALEWRKELNVHYRDKFVAIGQPIFY